MRLWHQALIYPNFPVRNCLGIGNAAPFVVWLGRSMRPLTMFLYSLYSHRYHRLIMENEQAKVIVCPQVAGRDYRWQDLSQLCASGRNSVSIYFEHDAACYEECLKSQKRY